MVRDRNQRLPIHVAAEEGHGSIVLVFLNQPFHKYGKDDQGRHLLHLLVMWQSDGFVRQCLKLHYAAIFGNWPAIKILLEIGSDPNLKDGLGNCPIHYALSSGSRLGAQPLI
ncbi:ankyrin, partial [Cadophora sp. DSE1049]